MRALVIGGDGFVGRWLIRHLLALGDAVDAVVGPRYSPPLLDVGRVERIDVRDGDALAAFVEESQPEAVYYLAGVSHQEGRDEVAVALGVSVVGGVNTLIAAAGARRPARVLYVSTGYVYAAAPDAVTEESRIAPDGLYAIAKLAGEESLRSLGPSCGVEIVIARPFNHIGAGQRATFVVPYVARQIGEIRAGNADAIHLRSGDGVRDFSDVRDVVRAYRLMLVRGGPGETYNVASGSGISIRSLAATMLEISGIQAAVEVGSDPGEIADVRIGDAAKLSGLGWARELSIRETLTDVLADFL